MLRWLKRRLRPPLPAGEAYATNPTPGNLYALIKKRCPVCGLAPPDWVEGLADEDAVCARCAAHYRVDQVSKAAFKVRRMQ